MAAVIAPSAAVSPLLKRLRAPIHASMVTGTSIVVDVQSFRKLAAEAGIAAYDSTDVRQFFASPVRFGVLSDLYDSGHRKWRTDENVVFVRLRSLAVKAGEVRIEIGFVDRTPDPVWPIEEESSLYTFVRTAKGWKMGPWIEKNVP